MLLALVVLLIGTSTSGGEFSSCSSGVGSNVADLALFSVLGDWPTKALWGGELEETRAGEGIDCRLAALFVALEALVGVCETFAWDMD